MVFLYRVIALQGRAARRVRGGLRRLGAARRVAPPDRDRARATRHPLRAAVTGAIVVREFRPDDADEVVARWHETNVRTYTYVAEHQRHTLDDARRFFAASSCRRASSWSPSATAAAPRCSRRTAAGSASSRVRRPPTVRRRARAGRRGARAIAATSCGSSRSSATSRRARSTRRTDSSRCASAPARRRNRSPTSSIAGPGLTSPRAPHAVRAVSRAARVR